MSEVTGILMIKPGAELYLGPLGSSKMAQANVTFKVFISIGVTSALTDAPVFVRSINTKEKYISN